MKRAVICFTRLPRPGQTKTRLIPLLGKENCVGLQWAFLRDLSAVYEKTEAALFVTYTPDPRWEELCAVFPQAVDFFPQNGAGLGARMDHAIQNVLRQGYDACVLTGSDLPLLTERHLASAFLALERADVTLGPTPDGGYYLVGMKKPCPAIFRRQVYGVSSVYENALAAAEEAAVTVCPAAPCGDVDTPEDLRELWRRIAGGDTCTARFLKHMTEAGVTL